MPHDVFISYASGDKLVADQLCATLESRHIRCWIAPRDVLVGAAYGECIVDAIHDCRIMILVFSAKANASQHIPKEIERAVSTGVTVIPVRIEDVRPGKSLDYFMANVHWHDAFPPPRERYFESLAENVNARLSRGSPAARAVIEPPVPAPFPTIAPAPPKQAPGTKWKAAAGVLSALVVLLMTLFLWRVLIHPKVAEQPNPSIHSPSQTNAALPRPESVGSPTGTNEVAATPAEPDAPP